MEIKTGNVGIEIETIIDMSPESNRSSHDIVLVTRLPDCLQTRAEQFI